MSEGATPDPSGQASGERRNDECLDELYRTFFLPLARRAVRKHGISFEDAGDVVQDAFLLAVARLDPEKNPKAWLYQVVDNLALNLKRKTLRRAGLINRWEASPLIASPRRRSVDE